MTTSSFTALTNVAIGLVIATIITMLVVSNFPPDRRIPMEGIITDTNDNFWYGQWTLIQQPDGSVIRAAGIWGSKGSKVKIKAVEVK